MAKKEIIEIIKKFTPSKTKDVLLFAANLEEVKDYKTLLETLGRMSMTIIESPFSNKEIQEAKVFVRTNPKLFVKERSDWAELYLHIEESSLYNAQKRHIMSTIRSHNLDSLDRLIAFFMSELTEEIKILRKEKGKIKLENEPTLRWCSQIINFLKEEKEKLGNVKN